MHHAVLFVALGGCASMTVLRGAPDTVRATYACADGSRVRVTFDNRAGTATLHRDGAKAVVLRQRSAASGIWYAAHDHELRGEGTEADITLPGRTPVACTARG